MKQIISFLFFISLASSALANRPDAQSVFETLRDSGASIIGAPPFSQASIKSINCDLVTDEEVSCAAIDIFDRPFYISKGQVIVDAIKAVAPNFSEQKSNPLQILEQIDCVENIIDNVATYNCTVAPTSFLYLD